MPGRMLPTGEPMPGKFDAPPKVAIATNRRADAAHKRRRDGIAGQAKVWTSRADKRKLSERLAAYVARRSSRSKHGLTR